MKNIEAGKFYKTGNGKKAFVACRNPFVSDPYNDEYWIGSIKEYGGSTWTKDGKWDSSGNSNDLVEEWRDPRELTQLFKLCVMCDGALYFARHITQPGHKVIGSVLVTAKEGEFADESGTTTST